MEKVYINGKFLCQKITGVQRVAIELLKEMCLQNPQEIFYIICPSNIINELKMPNLQYIDLKGNAGYFWEQVKLPKYCKKNKVKILINFCNIAPIRFPGICFVHDLAVIEAPRGYSWKQRLIYKLINKLNMKRYKQIFTVSNTMKLRIEKRYKVKNIVVIHPGYQHLLNIKEEKMDIKVDNFYLTVGSLNPNKNFGAIYKLAAANPDDNFVIVGGKYKSFNNQKLVDLKNLIFLGYVSDEQLVYLYKNAIAFLFPTKYEGFGMTPAEAICNGCNKIICNDIEVLREIYGGICSFANYCEPFILKDFIYYDVDLKLIEKYNWADGAKSLIDNISKL